MKLNGKISEAESVEVGHTKGANIANSDLYSWKLNNFHHGKDWTKPNIESQVSIKIICLK